MPRYLWSEEVIGGHIHPSSRLPHYKAVGYFKCDGPYYEFWLLIGIPNKPIVDMASKTFTTAFYEARTIMPLIQFLKITDILRF